MIEKKYTRGKYKIYEYDYSSIQDFLDTIIKYPINTKVFGTDLASEDYSEYFNRTRTFKEACFLCKFGWNDDFDYFKKELSKLEFKYNYESRKVELYDIVGSSVSVPRYLSNIPTNMKRKKTVYDRKTVDIFFNVSYLCETTHSQIMNRGILTLALIRYLESKYLYKVNLHFSSISYSEDEIIILNVLLKNYDRLFDDVLLKKCYFPFVHPDFFRRLCFRAREISSVTNRSWKNGYGRAMDYRLVKELILDKNKNYIYISNPQELQIYGEDINEDLENFIKNISYNYFEEEKENLKHVK